MNFLKKHLKKFLIAIGLLGVVYASTLIPVNQLTQPVGAIPCIEDTAKSVNEKISTCNLTAREQANFKGREIAKIGSIPKETHGKYQIEITDLKAIEEGVEMYVRAWDLDGTPIGLGVSKKAEKEHTRIFNPSILVDDPNGNIDKSHTDIRGVYFDYHQREDLRERLLMDVEDMVKGFGKKGSAVLGTVGRTTSIFYSDAGVGSTTSDAVIAYVDAAGITWASLIGQATGTGINSVSVSDGLFYFVAHGSTAERWIRLHRFGMTFSNLTTIGSDTVDSAALAVFGESETAGISTSTLNFYSFTPADNDTFTTADFDQGGTTAYSDTSLTHTTFTVGSYATSTLNATGIAAVNTAKSGSGIIGIMAKNSNYDAAGANPPWSVSVESGMFAYTADNGSNQPKLTVVHSAVAAAPAGGRTNRIQIYYESSIARRFI